MFLRQIRIAALVLAVFTVITGVVYPLIITGVAQLVFPGKANGSLLKHDGKILGSALIGQPFSDPKYFWGRLSSTSPYPYNAGSSAGSNDGPLNPALADAAQKRIQDLRKADPQNSLPIPVDLVTASASGLDPDISIAAALYQIPRVARTRGTSEERVRALVEQCTAGRVFGVLGEPRVNVLELNLALDGIRTFAEGK